jgi:transposase
VIFTHGAGLDVHQKTVMACRVMPDPTGQQADGLMELKEFGTMPQDLRALSDWLAEAGITHVAMESTGEYWRPVYNLLEGHVTIFLGNAAHVKQVAGRQTDKADARWLANLMRYGLLQASFIPPHGQRDVRDLTRDRTQLVQERRREVNRVQGVLERANITLASVAPDMMGVSGRAILAALLEGHAEAAVRAELAKGRMRTTIPLLEQALTGLLRDHHRRLLALHLAPIDFWDEPMALLHADITRGLMTLGPGEPPTPAAQGAEPDGHISAPDTVTNPLPLAHAVSVLDTIPGVDQRGAELLVAEGGTDRGRFGTAARLAAWTGVAPGHDERAGKRRSGKTRQGNRALRTGLTQMAHAAARSKGTSLAALYQRVAARRGKKRAIVAVAHAMVVSAFHMLSRHEPYQELGANDFDDQRRHQRVDRLARRLERLGYRVSFELVPAPAER